MIFINLDTGQYPLFDGDVALNPTANWASVVDADRPSEDPPPGFSWFESYPKVLEDGSFIRNWGLREMGEPGPPIYPHQTQNIE